MLDSEGNKKSNGNEVQNNFSSDSKKPFISSNGLGSLNVDSKESKKDNVSDLSNLSFVNHNATFYNKKHFQNIKSKFFIGFTSLILVFGVSSFGIIKLLSKNNSSKISASKVVKTVSVSLPTIPLSTVSNNISNIGLNNDVNIQGNLSVVGNENLTGSLTASALSGNGALVTGLNASNISSGQIGSNLLPANVTLLGQSIPVANLQTTVVASINGVVNNGGNININGNGIIVTPNKTTNSVDLSLPNGYGQGTITGIITGNGLTGGGSSGDVNIALDSSVTLQGNTFNGVNQLVKLGSDGKLPNLDGSNLVNINGSSIATGTINSSRLDNTTVTLQGNTFNGNSQLVQTTSNGSLPAINGSNVTNINGNNITIGSIPDNALSNNVCLGNINNCNYPTVTNTVALQSSNPGNAQIGNINISGTTSSGYFIGDGHLVANLNASNLTNGTINLLRLPTQVTTAGNTFNGPSQLLQATSLGYLPNLNGSLVNNINASNIQSGTLSDSLLSSNVPLINANNTFSGSTNNFSGTINTNNLSSSGGSLNVGNLSNALILQGSSISLKQGSSNTVSYVLPSGGSNETFEICTNIGNCGSSASTSLSGSINSSQTTISVNSASGFPSSGTYIIQIDSEQMQVTGGLGTTTWTVTRGYASTSPASHTSTTKVYSITNITGSGVANKITKFTGSQSIAASSISDNGSLVTLGTNTLAQPASNSTSTFVIQNSSSTPLFTADTTNMRVGIGNSAPQFPLDVAGNINSSTGIYVNGTKVCDATGCGSQGGSGYYIQNGTSTQSNSNLNIQTSAGNKAVAVFKGASGQTADLLDLQNSSSSNVASFSNSGNLNIIGSYQVNGVALASSNLTDSSNLAYLNANNNMTGNNTSTGTSIFKNTSTTALQIQSAASNVLLNADTSNMRVGINTSAPQYALDVNGSVNVSNGSNYLINGVPICSGDNLCAPSSGSGYYVQNSTVTQNSANLNIQSASASSVTAVLRGASSQSADILDIQNSNGITLANFSSNGSLTLGYSNLQSGSLTFNNSSNSNKINLIPQTTGTGNSIITIPNETGTICTTYASTACTSVYAPAGGSSNYLNLQSTSPGTPQTGNINLSGTAIAANFSGNGSNLTNLNGSSIATGTINSSRLDNTTVTLQGNTFNGNSQLVQTTSNGSLPSLSASNLTNLNGANITASTIQNSSLANSSISTSLGTNLTGSSSVSLGGTLNLGITTTPSFTSVNSSTDSTNSLNVTSASASNVTATISGTSSQTSDILDVNGGAQGSVAINANGSLNAPTGITFTSASTGGFLAAATYGYYVAASNGINTTNAQMPLSGYIFAGTANNLNTVSWNAVSNATNYVIYRTSSLGTLGLSFSYITIPATSTNIKDGLTNSTTANAGGIDYSWSPALTSTPPPMINTTGSGVINASNYYELGGIPILATPNNTSLLIGNGAGGNYANNNNASMTYNTAVGSYALNQNTTGGYVTAVGYQALSSNTTGARNSSLGFQALTLNTTGNYNTAVGYQSLNYNTTGNNNVGLGMYAGTQNSTGSANTFLGNSTQAGNNYAVNYSSAVGISSKVSSQNSISLGCMYSINTACTSGLSSTGGQIQTNVGIGSEYAPNALTIVPVSYGAGTNVNYWSSGTISQSGNTITGSGTSWSSGINNGSNTTIIYPDGTTSNVTFVSPTSLTSSVSKTVNAGSKYIIVYGNSAYSTGTISQSGNTITGTGTTFLSGMSSGTIYYQDGTSAVVTYANATTLYSSVSKTVTAGSTYNLVYGNGYHNTPGWNSAMSQSSNTITGYNTNFNSGMVGGTIYYNDGTTGTVTGYTSATSITSSVSKTISSWLPYEIVYGGFNVTGSGTAYIQPAADSTNIFNLSNSLGSNLLTANSTNQTLSVGTLSTPNTTAALQVVPASGLAGINVNQTGSSDILDLSSNGTVAAKFNNLGAMTLTSQSASAVTATISGASTQTADVLNVNGSATTYSTGTITQSAYTITGTGTSFNAGMVGMTIVYSDGTTASITAFVSTTSLTVSVSKTISTASTYTIYYTASQPSSNFYTAAGSTAIDANGYISAPTNLNYSFKTTGGFLAGGSLLFYAVVAKNAAGNSSNAQYLNEGAQPGTVAATGTALFNFGWAPVSNATSYTIYRSTTGFGSNWTSITVPSTVTCISDGLDNATSASSGGTIIYSDGTCANIVFVDATHLTSSISKTVTAGSSYTIYYGTNATSSYSTGTITQSGTAITGTGTTFTSAMNTGTDFTWSGTSAVPYYGSGSGIINAASYYSLGNSPFISAPGYHNIAIGTNAANNLLVNAQTTNTLNSGSNGGGNTAIGFNALANSGSTSHDVTVVGDGAGFGSYGSNNTFVGNQAGIGVGGTNNTCVGQSSCSSESGYFNTFLGAWSGWGVYNTGTGNTLIGTGSGFSSPLSGNGNASNNIVINSSKANLTTGNGDVFIGTNTTQNSNYQISNSVALGYGASMMSNNSIILGCNLANNTYCNAMTAASPQSSTNVGIGTNYAPNTLSITPNTYGSGSNRYYNTGTITQSGTTITGTGTSFPSLSNGGTIYYSDGTTATVTYVSATSLTSSVSKTIASASSYGIFYPGSQIYNTGTITQSFSAITGTGTSFNSNMVGGTIVYSDGTSAGITFVTNGTSMTVSSSKTIASASTYTIYYGGNISYNTGTISQSGTTITGNGTSFNTNMSNGTIYYSDGTTATISYSNGTTLYSSISKTVAAGSTYTIVSNGGQQGVNTGPGYNTVITQSGTTITGVGTSFTPAMNGATIYYNDGTTGILTYVSATSLTSSVSKTFTIAQPYEIVFGGTYVNNNTLSIMPQVSGNDFLNLYSSAGSVLTKVDGSGNINATSIDSVSASGTLNVATTNATTLNIGKSTTTTNISGSASVSGGFSVAGTQTVSSGNVVIGGISLKSITAPSAPTVITSGTPGTSSYSYLIAAVGAGGGTYPSTTGTVSTGNATLSATNYNIISWAPVNGVASYNIYRTYSTGSVNYPGLIGNTTGTSFSDTGITATTPPPGSDTSEQLAVTGYATFSNLVNSATAYSFKNSTGSSVLNVNTTNGSVCVGIGTCSGSEALGVIGNIIATGTITQNGSADYAENVSVSDSSIAAADIVSIDPNNSNSFVKSSSSYDATAVGVISTSPGFVTNGSDLTSSTTVKPLALSGRVPVKVSNENGEINIGDYITTSSISGVGMKSTNSGMVVGRAVSAFTGKGVGTVQIIVGSFYYNPGSVSGTSQVASLSVSGIANINTLNITGNLSVSGMTTLADVTINGHIITGGSTPSVSTLTSAGNGSNVSVVGNDTSGVITINTGTKPTLGDLINLKFSTAFNKAPIVMITAKDPRSANIGVYQDNATTTDFNIGAANNPSANTSYQFNYFVIE